MHNDVLTDFDPSKDTLRILLVEDSEVQRIAIRYVLQKDPSTSYEIVETAKGEEGLEIYQDGQIDCVILDYLLPDIDGIEFLKRVRHDDGFVDRPILFITAEGDRTIVAKAMELGATDYIEKHRYEKDHMLARTVQRAIDRKRYEHMRRESDEFLRSVLNTIPLPVFYKTTDLRFADCNDAFASFFGLRKDQIIGKTAHDIAPERYAQDYERRDKEILRTQQPQRYEMPVLAASGALREVEFHKSLYRDTQGKTKGIIGVFTDITDMKRVRDELLKAKVEAEFASQSKTQFIANTSHEIRTPLNGVVGMLKLLGSTSMTSEQREYLDVATNAAGSLLDVVDDVIDVSRIESGKIELQKTDFDLSHLLRTVMDSFAGHEKLQFVEMRCEVDENVPEIIHTDEGALRQILFNLVGNAFKYTRRGTITLEVNPLFQIPGKPQLLFSIADTGPGISDEAMGYIFEPYFRGRRTDDPDHEYRKIIKGSGLGLSIVKRLVHMLDGTLSVETEPGAGTTMHFSLPIVIPDPASEIAEPETTSRVQGDMRSLSILVAEDNPVNQLVLCRTLEKLGHKAVVAADGYEVLDRMREKVFDLVLMDIQMPEMNGIETTRRIRGGKGQWDPNIPIIAVTAHAMKGDRERMIEQGMNEYLPKPVDIDNLDKVIQRVCMKE
ncbi:hybrid sensor histidine kinase/response regulator [Oceanidesulfovibrio indonesiensis]|nr:hybrid sensor histidine kinase/response regulator [Oceanidesulfovibrio indonesiensis]